MSDRDGSSLAESAERIFRQLQDGVDDSKFELPHGVHDILKLLAANDSTEVRTNESSEATPNGLELNSIEIGRFRLTKCLGQGGYGIVYLGRDTLLDRTVAVKIPKPHVLLTGQLRERFIREARAASAIHHPHIAQVYDASEAEAAFYIASEYCDGGSLDDWLRKQDEPLEPKAVAQLMASISDAVHHAHLAGILHRDLKPGNILLKSTSSPPNNGIPYVAKVADFGLAKLEGPGQDTTMSGAILGSVRYMSPEQATGNNKQVDARSDIYSLGVILYQLLTGAPPFNSESQLQLLRDVVEKMPPSVRSLNPSIPRDLAAICMKCLEKKPSRRYSSAAHLRDDLQRFLKGETTLARPIHPLEAVGRWSIQYPTHAALIGVICLSLIVGSVGLLIHNRMINASLQDLTKIANNLEQREDQLRTDNYASDTAISFSNWHHLRPKQTSSMLGFQRQQPMAKSYLGVESHLLNQLVNPPNRLLYQSEFPVHGVLIPGGESYAFVEGTSQIHFIDLKSGRRGSPINTPFAALRELAVTTDGRFLAVSSETPRDSLANAKPPSRVGVFDLVEGGFRIIGQHENTVESLAFAPNSFELVSASRYENVLRQDILAQTGISTDRNLSRNESIAFSPDGTTLAYSVFSKSRGTHKLRLVDLQSGKITQRPIRRKDEYLCFSHDGKWLVVSNLYRVQVFDTETFDVVETLSDINARTAAIAFTPDDRFIAVATRDGAIRFWEQEPKAKQDRLPNREYRRRFNPVACTNHHDARIRSLAFDQHQRLITAGDDGAIRICDLTEFLKPKSIGPSTGSVRAMDHTADGTIALALSDGRHWLKRPGADPKVARLNKRSGHERRIALSRDANWMALSLGNRVDVVKTSDMQPIQWKTSQVGTEVNGLCFVPNRKQIVTTHADDRHLYVWDIAQRSLVNTIDFPRPIAAPCFSNDQRTLIVCERGDDNPRMFVCDGSTFEIQAEYPLQDPSFSVRFNSDDSTLAIGHVNGQISLWNTSVWQQTHWLDQHDPVWIYALAFSQDGRTLVSGCDDGSIRMWHVETGAELGNLSRDRHTKVRGLMFPPHGHSLVVAHVTGAPPLVEYDFEASKSQLK